MIGVAERLLPGIVTTQLDEVTGIAVAGQSVQELAEYGDIFIGQAVWE